MKYRKQKEIDLSNKPTRWYSDKQETRVASELNGRKTKNSGATMFDSGDVKTKKWIIECKTKMSDVDSISIKKEWLEKNKAESIIENKPFYTLTFNFGPHSKEDYYIIDKQTFILMKEALEKYIDEN